MIGIKTALKTQVSSFIDKLISPNKFPDTPEAWWKQKAVLLHLINRLKKLQSSPILGHILTYPHPSSIKIWKELLRFNPNNLGSWTNNENASSITDTRTFEKEVINKLINLYHASPKKISGYITTGGTESNLYSAWLGKNYLSKYTDNIHLIKSSLTHYSVDKAADIVSIPTTNTHLDENYWSINANRLKDTVRSLYRKKVRGFLLPLTLGYTLTGTSDPVQDISTAINTLKRELKNIYFFTWIDAAFNGLVEPFVNPVFKPFSSPNIQTFITDFHKFGQTPYPSGVVLYRTGLQKLIEKPIPYLSEKDNTVLGSRSGIPAVACWNAIHSLGKEGYRNIIKRCLNLKNDFISDLKKSVSDTTVITSNNSLIVGVLFNSFNKQRLPKHIESKFGLYPAVVKLSQNKSSPVFTIYKVVFLPHTKRSDLMMLIQAISRSRT